MFLFKWLRNIVLLLLFIVVGVGLFILGFQHNFPGETIAQYLERQVAQQSPLQIKIDPLGWKNLHRLGTDRVAILAPPSIPLSHLFVIENVEIDLLPRLDQLPRFHLEQWQAWSVEDMISVFDQDLDIRGQAYGGQMLGTVNYLKRETAGFLIRDMSLDHIPAVHLIPYASLKGTVGVQGIIWNLQELQSGKSQLPKGRMEAKFEDVRIQTKNLEQLIPGGFPLPELSFPEIIVDVDYNKFLNIRNLQLKGSIEGTIDGKIFINHRNMLASRVQLHLKLKLSEKFEQALGPMALLLQGMQCGDVLDFDLSGTLGRLKPPRKRACS